MKPSPYFKHPQALVDDGAQIGEGTRVWAFCHIQHGAKVGRDCNVCNGTFIEKGAVVGDNVTIKHNVSIFDKVTIEDYVFIGSNIAFINDKFPRSKRSDSSRFETTLIKKGATLGANAVIMCGISVGQYAMVGAGAVVTKTVEDHALVVGNPARLRGYVCVCGDVLNAKFSCKCGKKYRKMKKGLVPS